jgi:hypothetical protein
MDVTMDWDDAYIPVQLSDCCKEANFKLSFCALSPFFLRNPEEFDARGTIFPVMTGVGAALTGAARQAKAATRIMHEYKK